MNQTSEMNLTQMEREALEAAIKSSDGNGHDFGCTDEVVDILKRTHGYTPQQSGALLVSLQTKGLIRIWKPVRVNGNERVQQFEIPSLRQS